MRKLIAMIAAIGFIGSTTVAPMIAAPTTPGIAQSDDFSAAKKKAKKKAKKAEVTAIELSAPNRPFIFDSVLGELQARGHPVRLVVHPILDVDRNASGEVLRFDIADERKLRMRAASGGFQAEGKQTITAPMPGKIVKTSIFT